MQTQGVGRSLDGEGLVIGRWEVAVEGGRWRWRVGGGDGGWAVEGGARQWAG